MSNATETIFTQSSGAAQAAVTTTVGDAVDTTGATNSSPYGYAEAQANAIVTNVNALRVDTLALAALVNEMRSVLVARGFMKGSA